MRRIYVPIAAEIIIKNEYIKDAAGKLIPMVEIKKFNSGEWYQLSIDNKKQCFIGFSLDNLVQMIKRDFQDNGGQKIKTDKILRWILQVDRDIKKYGVTILIRSSDLDRYISGNNI